MWHASLMLAFRIKDFRWKSSGGTVDHPVLILPCRLKLWLAWIWASWRRTRSRSWSVFPTSSRRTWLGVNACLIVKPAMHSRCHSFPAWRWRWQPWGPDLAYDAVASQRRFARGALIRHPSRFALAVTRRSCSAIAVCKTAKSGRPSTRLQTLTSWRFQDSTRRMEPLCHCSHLSFSTPRTFLWLMEWWTSTMSRPRSMSTERHKKLDRRQSLQVALIPHGEFRALTQRSLRHGQMIGHGGRHSHFGVWHWRSMDGLVFGCGSYNGAEVWFLCCHNGNSDVVSLARHLWYHRQKSAILELDLHMCRCRFYVGSSPSSSFHSFSWVFASLRDLLLLVVLISFGVDLWFTCLFVMFIRFHSFDRFA